MGIRSGCGRRIQEQETAPFFVLPARVDGNATKYFCEFSKGAEQNGEGKKKE